MDDELDALFAKEYLDGMKSVSTLVLGGGDPASVSEVIKSVEPEHVFALGSETFSTLEKVGVEAVYLPHPATFKTNAKRARRKVLDIYTQNMVQSQPLTARIAKSEDAKQIVYSVVLDPYQFDAHNDWVPASEVEKTAHDWMRKSRTIGLNHEKWNGVGAQVVESYIERYPSQEEYRKAMQNEPHKAFRLPFGEDKVHSGSWVMGVKLDDSLWQLHKSGEIDAYSIGGFGIRRPATEQSIPEVTFVDLS